MTGVGGDTGRGLRVAARGFRTWQRLAWFVAFVAMVAGLAGAVWKTTGYYTSHDWHVFGVYALSELMLVAGFDPDKSKKIRDLDGTVLIMTLDSVTRHAAILGLRERMLGDAHRSGLRGGGIGAGLVIATLLGLRAFGSRLKRGKRLRGGDLVGQKKLAPRTLPWWRDVMLLSRGCEARPYEIAGIPWPKGAETSHTIVSGTTGSGKTVLIADLVEQIRARGERCIVYDKMGSYTETFFDRDRDILLNPLDDRSPRWSPFLEARTDRDFDTMAHALIPLQKDAADPFWITAARQLFSRGAEVLWKRGETRNRVLVGLLLKTELSELADAMEGTTAQSIVDPQNPKTALSVRAMLTANIGAMDLLSDEGDPFSIREWIEREEGSGFLFLTSRGDQHASLRGLISTWLEIAVNALLSLPRSDDRRIWVILDELPTLHQLPSLRSGLAESRQFGGCFVLGVQVFSALRDIYGRDAATTISGLCGTRVVLAAPDKDTSEWAAESLGRAEVETLSEGVSYDTPRDGVTLSTRSDLRPLVLPAEVARLEKLAGYLKFPGAWPVARIRLKYRDRPAVAHRFVPRAEDGGDAGERRTAPKGAAAKGAAPATEARQPGPARTMRSPGGDAGADADAVSQGGRAPEAQAAATGAGKGPGKRENEPERATPPAGHRGEAEPDTGGGIPADTEDWTGEGPAWLFEAWTGAAGDMAGRASRECPGTAAARPSDADGPAGSANDAAGPGRPNAVERSGGTGAAGRNPQDWH